MASPPPPSYWDYVKQACLRPIRTRALGAMPLTQMLFFTFLGSFATGPENAHFYVIGNAVQIAAVSGIFGVTMSVGGERWSGTLVYLFGAPANRMMMG